MDEMSRAGGASTISGVIYQILWCVLRSLRIRASVPQAGGAGNAILVLEPTGGGGDVQVITEFTEIEQLKAKANEGTWSLRALVEAVLPDLFIAAREETAKHRFRFVTEGRMGNWSQVYDFFRQLSGRDPAGDVLSLLDDAKPLRFQRKVSDDPSEEPFFPAPAYTERTLFLLIAKALCDRPAISKLKLCEAELHRRLWTVLANFEFVGGQRHTLIEEQIDQLLMAVVDNKDELPNIRASLVMSLMAKAGKGNVELSVSELLEEQGIDATPLTRWSEIVARSQDELRRHLANRRYRMELDVRDEQARKAAARWRDSHRTLVISGESGQGKSWLLAATALASIQHDAPVIWVDATGDVGYDLTIAADEFWRTVRNGEAGLPLRQIATRLAGLVPSYAKHRLRLCLDNVATYREAEAIVRENWPSLGISVAMSCPREITNAIVKEFGARVEVIESADFSWEELHDRLNRSIGSAWTTVPEDVRRTLRRPLLAGIYCEELYDGLWRGSNEYELFSAMWDRLSAGHQISSPLDAARLETLILGIVQGDAYPWRPKQLIAHGIDDAALGRLERCGWLLRTGDNRIQISSDRLANWAVAQALFDDLTAGAQSAEDVVAVVARMDQDGRQAEQLSFGYVPMDFLWLISGRMDLVQVGVALLEALEAKFGHSCDILYRHLVPTLGERVAEILFVRFKALATPYLHHMVRDALLNVGENRLCSFAATLLNDSSGGMQRRGLQLLRGHACPHLLDRIWHLHKLGLEDPTPFLSEHEQNWQFRDDSWPALRSAAVANPNWIVQSIAEAGIEEPVHELGWLVANLKHGGPVWQSVKDDLFAKVAPDKSRVLARCAGIFKDRECLPWLIEQSARRGSMIDTLALQAISRIDADESVRRLDSVAPDELLMSSEWLFGEVWARRIEAINAKMVDWAKAAGDVWKVASIYRGRAHEIPLELFEQLLTSLEDAINAHFEQADEKKGVAFYRELALLADAVSPDQIRALEAKRGSALEYRLGQFVRGVGPQRGIWWNGHERVPALTLLHRIGGQEFTDVVNTFLRCEDRHGRHEALEWAMKQPNEETYRIASELVQRDELWDGTFPLEQNDAMRLLASRGQWAEVAAGLRRWGLQTSIHLTDERFVPENYSDSWLDDSRQRLRSAPTVGDVIALSFAGASTDTALLQDIFESAEKSSDLAHACIIGLELLGDSSDRGVRLVASHLKEKRRRHSATRMLTHAGTDAAWDALWEDLQSEFSHINAVNLLNLSRHAKDVAAVVSAGLATGFNSMDWPLLRILILDTRVPELKRQILNDQWLREKLRREAVADEGSFWFTGSKEAAIQCLAEMDRAAALSAAIRAIRNTAGHDRERYPYLLEEVDSLNAGTLLFDQLLSEKNEHVRYAIGRVLSQRDCQEQIRQQLGSTDPKVRSAACFAAGWLNPSDDLLSTLHRLLDDENDAVIGSARDAVDQLRRTRTGDQLLGRAAACRGDLNRTIAYLDAYIDLVDPGDEFRPYPAVLWEAIKHLPLHVRKHLHERRKKCQGELQKELKRKSERRKD